MVNFLIISVSLIVLLLLEAVTDATDFLYQRLWNTYSLKKQKMFGLISHSTQLLLFTSFTVFGAYVGYVSSFMTRNFNWVVVGYVLLAYVLFRISFFNVVYNKLVGQSLLSIGTSNIYDKILNWIIKMMKKIGVQDIRYFEMIYENGMVLCFFLACCAVIGAIHNIY